MADKELKALFSLLDDPEEDIFTAVRKKLLSMGKGVVPELEGLWEQSFDDTLNKRIEGIIDTLQFSALYGDIKNWALHDGADLLKGVCHVARFQYSELDFDLVDKEIEKLQQDVWLEINDNLTALEKVKILNHVIFDVHKFENEIEYASPHSYFIDQVLLSQRGSSIILAVIYLLVAKRLGLPIYGVNMPHNFLLAYKDEFPAKSGKGKSEFEDDILFYINPFNRGRVLGRREIDYFLKQLRIPWKQDYFVPCTNQAIVHQVIDELVLCYEHLNYPKQTQSLMRLKAIFETES